MQKLITFYISYIILSIHNTGIGTNFNQLLDSHLLSI